MKIVTKTIYIPNFKASTIAESDALVALKRLIFPCASITIYLGIQLKLMKSTNSPVFIPFGKL